MGLSAVEKIFTKGKSLSDVSGLPKISRPVSWLDNVRHSMAEKSILDGFRYNTMVHPCLINGRRFLVYERGLRRTKPEAYANLEKFANENNFTLREDRRTNTQPVKFERRRARAMPLLFLASGIFMQGTAGADTITPGKDVVVKNLPEVVVRAKRNKPEREFQVRHGKRFVTNPYGDVEAILAVASATKRQGQLKRVSTRGITMPHDYTGGIINRYDYQFPRECGGGKFSYYEGDGFGALGYHNNKTVILDVMVGGGPFTAPQLWGPYDQLLGDRHNVSMKFMMGNGQRDGMGILKASYAIGMTTVMKQQDYETIGNAYVKAVQQTASCVIVRDAPTDPVIRQAKNDW